MDEFYPEIEVDRCLEGQVRAVVAQDKTAVPRIRGLGSQHPPCVAEIKARYRAGRRRPCRPRIPEPSVCDREADPPKVLVIGPARLGNLLEVIVLELADKRLHAIHAMPLRRSLFDLLADPE